MGTGKADLKESKLGLMDEGYQAHKVFGKWEVIWTQSVGICEGKEDLVCQAFVIRWSLNL